MTVAISLVDAMRAIAELRAEVAALRKELAELRPKPLPGLARVVAAEHAVLARIGTEVAEAHGLTLEHLRGASRHHHIAQARQEAFARCLEAGRSSTQIGRYFGGRDHSTVLHGARAHRARIEGVQ